MKHLSVAALLLVLLTSCNNVLYIHTSETAYPGLKKRHVEVYKPGREPKGVDEVGIIVVNTPNKRKAGRKASKKAAAYGADGIYVQKMADKKDGDRGIIEYLAEHYPNKITFIAIKKATNRQS